MHQRLYQGVLALAISACPVAAQTPVEIWNHLSQAAFDPEKSAAARNLTLVRDRFRLTLNGWDDSVHQAGRGRDFRSCVHGARARATLSTQ